MKKLTINLQTITIKADRPTAASRLWSAEEIDRIEAEVVSGVVFRYASLEGARTKSRGDKKARRSSAAVAVAGK